MPFKSDKQRRYLWSQKPEVAKQIAYKNKGGWWNQFTDASPMQIRNRQYAQYTRQGSPGKFDEWLAAGGGQNVDRTQPSIQKSVRDVARVATPYGSVEDAYKAGEYFAAGDIGEGLTHAGLAAAGIVPGVRAGKAAAKAVNRVTPKALPGYVDVDLLTAGQANKLRNMRLTRKEQLAAKHVPGGEDTIRNMKFEAQHPELAAGRNLGGIQQVRPQLGKDHPYMRAQQESYRTHGPGAHPGGAGGMGWKPFDTKEGQTISSTFDPKGNVQNILDVPGRPKSIPTPNPRRGEAEFNVVTQSMVDAGHPGQPSKISQLISAPGPLSGAASSTPASSVPGPVRALMQRQGWSQDKATFMAKQMGLI